MLAKLYDRFRRVTTNNLYLPELDGIRFIILTQVVLIHIRGYFLKKTPIHFADNVDNYYWLNRFIINFDRTVPLFFAISGFILAVPFAQQYINNGKKIELKQYYLRRLTRLEPPYFIIMTTIFLMQLGLGTNTFHVLFPSLLASYLYSHNAFFHHTPLLTVVAWTLEIEIQFYLIAPLLFKLLTLPKISRRNIMVSSILMFVALQYMFPPAFLNVYKFIQYFLVGILVADLYVCGVGVRSLNKKGIAIASLVVFLVLFFLPRWEDAPHPELQIVKAIFPFLIVFMYLVVLRNNTVKRILGYGCIPVIGGMCYSIYLVHYTVISMVGRFTVRLKFTDYYIPNMILQFILLCAAVLLVSSFVYLFIERPFMTKKWMYKLKRKESGEAATGEERRILASD